MSLRRVLAVFCFMLMLCGSLMAATTPAEAAANAATQREMDTAPRNGNLPSYSLKPDALEKAQHLEQVHDVLHFGNLIWGILQLLLLLSLGLIARFRNAVTERFRSRWLQGYGFLFLFLLATTLLSLPVDMYGHWLSRRYGLSVQSWPSWAGDQMKGFALGWAIGGLLLMLLFWLIRKLPRYWWLAFWGASIPIMLIGIFASPYIIDPLFNKFEPLVKSQPELVRRLEAVAQRGNMDIAPDRMFLMKASEKVTTMNAYVTGFGASKRVVVWDTSLKQGTPDEVLFIFGHESGHYVLHHIVRGLVITSVILLLFLFLGFHAVGWMLRRFGPAWGIPSQSDWGTLAVLMLAFTVFSAISEPIEMALTRVQEHAADVYGQEAIHGIVADPREAARGAFQVLGESSFDVPNPSQAIEFWTYSHPAIGRRAAFAAHYDPWATGAQPKYFAK